MSESVRGRDEGEVRGPLGEGDRRSPFGGGPEPVVVEGLLAVDVAREGLPVEGEAEEAHEPEVALADAEADGSIGGAERDGRAASPRDPGHVDAEAGGARLALEEEGGVGAGAGPGALLGALDLELAQEEAEEVDVVNAHVGEDAASRERGVDPPAPRRAGAVEDDLRLEVARSLDERDLGEEAVVLGDADESGGGAEVALEGARSLERRLDGLLDEDGLARARGLKSGLGVAGGRRRDEDGVGPGEVEVAPGVFLRAAEGARRGAGALEVARGEGDLAAAPREGGASEASEAPGPDDEDVHASAR